MSFSRLFVNATQECQSFHLGELLRTDPIHSAATLQVQLSHSIARFDGVDNAMRWRAFDNAMWQLKITARDGRGALRSARSDRAVRALKFSCCPL